MKSSSTHQRDVTDRQTWRGDENILHKPKTSQMFFPSIIPKRAIKEGKSGLKQWLSSAAVTAKITGRDSLWERGDIALWLHRCLRDAPEIAEHAMTLGWLADPIFLHQQNMLTLVKTAEGFLLQIKSSNPENRSPDLLDAPISDLIAKVKGSSLSAAGIEIQRRLKQIAQSGQFANIQAILASIASHISLVNRPPDSVSDLSKWVAGQKPANIVFSPGILLGNRTYRKDIYARKGDIAGYCDAGYNKVGNKELIILTVADRTDCLLLTTDTPERVIAPLSSAK